MQPTILLLQARLAGDPMARHEHRCFAEQSGLQLDDVIVYDLCAGPPTLAHVRAHDALMVGGSGEYYVSKANLPDFPAFLDLLREIVAVSHPTFASCFGYQSLVVALGGEILFDPERAEVGTYRLELNDRGRSDELFGALPDSFNAQMGHKDRAIRHPDGVPNLASSEASPFQALRIPKAPIWAAQFHPELDRETNLDRYRHYLKGYSRHMSADEQEKAFDRFKESPEASSLLRRFLSMVFT